MHAFKFILKFGIQFRQLPNIIKLKTPILAFFLLFSSHLLQAQTDSIRFSSLKWDKKKVAQGMNLRQTWVNDKSLFASNQCISILEIKSKRKTEFDIGFEPKYKKTTQLFGDSTRAVAAINGTFFDVQNGGSVDFLKVDGRVINDNRLNKSGRAVHQKAAIAISKGKNFDILQWDGTPDWEKRIAADDIMLSGPLLLADRKNAKLDSGEFSKLRHPRSAVATSRRNRVLFITVDGRNENGEGMSLFELQSICRWLGVEDALNLDGGGSTTLWVKNSTTNGVVNYPSDNKKWDHEGSRKVANVILVKRK